MIKILRGDYTHLHKKEFEEVLRVDYEVSVASSKKESRFYVSKSENNSTFDE